MKENVAAHHMLKLGLFCLLLMQGSALCLEIDMKPYWNDKIALENPHKGWYHHYPDNHINKYIIRDDSHLLDLPGMDHIYIRLAWAYLEPQEGKFNWDIIDDIINKWTQKGLKISFRISCKETSTDRIEQQFATPKWVMEAGAKGDYYRSGKQVGPDGPWEPVFDDPVFLEKLENFIQAFAQRYDGKPWIRYIDIGSFGDWGEGHTHSGSRIKYDIDQLKIHVDLYRKYFLQSQLIISDGFVWHVKNPNDRDPLHRYILNQGISYRDDSILVAGFVRNNMDTFSVRSPELFANAYRTMPTVLELQHYHAIKRDGNWVGQPGSSLLKYGKGKSGADVFRGSLKVLHATYIGYHGDAHEWLTDNPELTVELLNRCGYWYFLHHVDIPDTLRIGSKNTVNMVWENRGVAPAYYPYVLTIRLAAGRKTIDFKLQSGNRRWMPVSTDGLHREKYTVTIPNEIPPGQYELKLKLHSNQEKKDVLLALDPDLWDGEKYYTVAKVRVEK